MTRPVVDGQRQPKAPPLGEIPLRNLCVDPIAAPETIEVSLSTWTALDEADEWAETIPMDLSELKGA